MLLVNSTVTGIESVGINVLGDVNIQKQQEIIFVCNKDAKDFPSSVYVFLRDCLRNGKRVFLIVVGDCDHKLFSNLMVLYGAYDIYNIADERMLNERFIRGMISRKCGIEDVSQFVGCEAIAYGNLETVVLGLAERADELDIDDVEADALYGSAEVISYLKAVDAEFNYKEKDRVISDLKSNVDKLTEEKERLESDLAVAEDSISNLTSRLEVARARVDELESAPQVQQTQVVRGAMVVQPTCLTDSLMTDTKHVIYFKELTPIPYINTFVKYLADYIRTRKMSGKKVICKLTIFDFNGTQKLYHPIPYITGDEYMARRMEMAGSRMELAIATPQMAVLSDLLTGKYSGADTAPNVLIVYDRTHQHTDIITGKIVTKFFICHSRSAVERLAQDFHIKDPSKIITTADTFIHSSQLDIPRIKGFSTFESESRRKRAYLGLRTRYGNQPLMDAVLEACGMSVKGAELNGG